MNNTRTSAAVLILVRRQGTKEEVLLIERSATVKTHQSQVAFPGGGTEPGEESDPARTALRECFEEVGIPPHFVQVSRTFPPLPTVTGSFFVVPVLGRLDESVWGENTLTDFILDPQEVAYAEWVSIEALLNTKTLEYGFPVFQWAGKDQKKRRVWGLTAVIFDRIFNSEG